MNKNEKNFGSAEIKSLTPLDVSDKTVNICIGFKEALQLHLSLGQCLQKLNRYNMTTEEGKNAAVKIVVYGGKKKQIMITEG